jgi:hypothetical protein
MLPFSEYLDKLPLPAIRRFEKARATVWIQTIYGLIRERRKSGEDTGDLLSMLLLAQDEEADGAGMTDDEQVRDEALTLFLAGHETTRERAGLDLVSAVADIRRCEASAASRKSIRCSPDRASCSWPTCRNCAMPRWYLRGGAAAVSAGVGHRAHG